MKNKLKLFSNLYLRKKNPVSLIIFVTNRCNARCSFCFIDFNNSETQNKKNELTVEEYKKMSLSLKGSLHHLNFTGGEPFIRQDLDQIVQLFINNCVLSSVIFSTNGSYPRKIQSFLNDVCKINKETKFIFQFSIDSFSEEHNKIRKIPGLFDKTIESYNLVKSSYNNCIATCNLTVSEDNYKDIDDIYDFLTNEHKIETINPIILRSEGVYTVPLEKKEALLNAYTKLTNRIVKNVRKGNLRGFSNFSLEGEVLNAKNEISYELTKSSYLNPKFYAYCVAGTIFGVVHSDGTVFPCEILDKPLGNLKDYDYDFLKLWEDNTAVNTRKWIKDTKCNCHWECIYTYNLISDPTYLTKIGTKMIANRIYG